MISVTGNGLTLLICADYNVHHEWMSYASWYSAHRIFPDAEICVCLSKKRTNQLLFNWTARAGIKQYRLADSSHYSVAQFALANKISQPLVIIAAGVVSLKSFPPIEATFARSEDHQVWWLNDLKVITEPIVADLCCPCTEYHNVAFTQVESTCGAFNKKTWLEKAKLSPFAGNYKRENISPNEYAVLTLWEQMQKSYHLMSLPV